MAETSAPRLLSSRAALRRFSIWASMVPTSASTSSSSKVARASTGSVSPGASSLSKARSTRHSASTSRIPARKRLPSPSPVEAPGTRPAMSTTSIPAWTTFLLALIAANASSRASGRGAMETDDSVVVKGWGATAALAPVRALNKDVFPALGRPTRPRRSIGPDATRPSAGPSGAGRGRRPRDSNLGPYVETDQQAQDPRQEEGQPRQAAQRRSRLSDAGVRGARRRPAPAGAAPGGWAGPR